VPIKGIEIFYMKTQNATNSDGNSSDTTDQGGEMVRKLQGRRLYNKDVDYMRFKITQAEVQPTMNISTHKSERQVLMQYMKATHRWSIS
jgi:hypothetical protein